MIKPNTYNQTRFVPSENCRAANILAEGLAFPFEVGLATVHGFVREAESIVHTAGSSGEECCMASTPTHGPFSTDVSSTAF